MSHNSGPPAKRIEDIQLGDRVAGRNPHREEVELVEPDEETWREVRLRLKKNDGGLLWINLLRPVEWLEIQEAQVGGKIFLDLPEMGALGDADVLELLPCPKIDVGQGAVITGQFRHEVTNGEIVELRLAGQTTPTRVTANHPYWSVDRQKFVVVGDLRTAERVDTVDGAAEVTSFHRIPYQGVLYNLETSEHVYRVGSAGLLVHNSCLVRSHLQTLDVSNSAWRQATMRRGGLVYVLRDIRTGELLKVGQTTSRTFTGRFEQYVAAGNRTGRHLAVDVFHTSFPRRGLIEREIRKHLGLLYRLPWDNTALRLGRGGIGLP